MTTTESDDDSTLGTVATGVAIGVGVAATVAVGVGVAAVVGAAGAAATAEAAITAISAVPGVPSLVGVAAQDVAQEGLQDGGQGIVHQPLESSHLVSAGFDKESGTIEVLFWNGRMYQYSGDEMTYLGLMSAESPGKFVWANLRGREK